MRSTRGLLRFAPIVAAAVLAGCGNSNVITGGAQPTASPVVPHLSLETALSPTGAAPAGITLNTSGGLYVADPGADAIDVVQGSAENSFPVPTANAGLFGITSLFSTVYASESNAGQIAILPTTATVPKEYSVATPYPGARPTYMTAGPDGFAWFSDPGTNSIGTILASGTVTEYPLPAGSSGPAGLVSGNDGASLWVAFANSSQIGQFDTTTKTFTHVYSTATPNASPTQIVLGPDTALWFTEPAAGKIGRMTQNGIASDYAIAPAQSIAGLVVGADDNLWFTDPAGNAFGRIVVAGTPPSGSSLDVTTYPLTSSAALTAADSFMVLGSDERIYITEHNTGKIGQITYF